MLETTHAFDLKLNKTKALPVTHLVPGTAMDYAVAKVLGLETRYDFHYGFLINYVDNKYTFGRLENGWARFSPSLCREHTWYAREKYLRSIIDKLKTTLDPESEAQEIIVNESMLRSWPHWNDSYKKSGGLYQYVTCATILMNMCGVDPIQGNRTVDIPTVFLEE